MYSLFKFNTTTGGYEHALGQVKLGVLATGGGGLDSGLQLIETTFQTMAGFAGRSFASLLVPFAPLELGVMQQQSDIQAKALAFGQNFLG